MNAPLLLLWDASALIKKYLDESGSETVEALFAWPDPSQMISTLFTFAETAAILRRRFNRQAINLREFNVGRMLLEQEVLIASEFELLSLSDDDIMAGLSLTDQHNLNSTDAAILACFLRRLRSGAPIGTPILVASDRHLLRAAAAEGLRTLNPEAVVLMDLPALLAGP